MKVAARFALLAALALAGCSRQADVASTTAESADAESPGAGGSNIYAAIGIDELRGAAPHALPLVYVPNSHSASVTVIDPTTYRVVRTFTTDAVPQHVVPSHDLATLWVTNNEGNSLTSIDPRTGREGAKVPVTDPYNLYFTPDGRFALVIAEARDRFDFRDPNSMTLIDSVPVQCKGLNHIDFAADGSYAIASCEFSAQLVKLDLATRTPAGYLTLERDGSGRDPMPQDVRTSPDGRTFFVADMMADGIHLIDPEALQSIGFVPTGRGAHGIVTGRGGEVFYIANRGWHRIPGGRRGPGSISVLDPGAQRVIATWPVPGGGSPDMGNVTADGRELWISGRYDDEVYVFDTATGEMTHRLAVGREPHGVLVWPQPGRYSLGHTGNMR